MNTDVFAPVEFSQTHIPWALKDASLPSSIPIVCSSLSPMFYFFSGRNPLMTPSQRQHSPLGPSDPAETMVTTLPAHCRSQDCPTARAPVAVLFCFAYSRGGVLLPCTCQRISVLYLFLKGWTGLPLPMMPATGTSSYFL